jgi:hypothetical protein
MKIVLIITTLVAVLAIGLIGISNGSSNSNTIDNAFAQEKNDISETEDSPLITTEQIDESMETNNTSSQMDNHTSMIE